MLGPCGAVLWHRDRVWGSVPATVTAGGAARRGRLQAQARHGEDSPPAQPGGSRWVEASAPSVSHCPTSIPQPLALILSLPHAGQRQKQSGDNPSVPPAEPRPHSRKGPRHRAMGIAPARPGGLQGSSPGIPQLWGLRWQQGPEPHSRLSCLGEQQPRDSLTPSANPASVPPL